MTGRADGGGAPWPILMLLVCVLVFAAQRHEPPGYDQASAPAGQYAVVETKQAHASISSGIPFAALIPGSDGGEGAVLPGKVVFADQSLRAREAVAPAHWHIRGTPGPSLMFEPRGHSLWLMPLFARTVSHPPANTLASAVNRRPSNDTDFSDFKKHRFDGFHFSSIGSVTCYHVRKENSGQQGAPLNAALRMAMHENPASTVASQFDPHRRMVWWPEKWTPWMGWVAMALMLGCIWGLLRRRKLTARNLGKGVVFWVLVLGATRLLALLLRASLHAVGTLSNGPVAYSTVQVAAFLLLGLSVAFGAAAWVGERVGFQGLWSGTWLCWAAVAVTAGLAAPESSPPWVIPALTAGILGLDALFFSAPGWRQAAAFIPAMVAALLLLDAAPKLYAMAGPSGLPMAAMLLAALGTTLGPLIVAAPRGTRRALAVTVALGTVVLAVLAALYPAKPAPFHKPAHSEFVWKGRTARSRWAASEKIRLNVARYPNNKQELGAQALVRG